MCFIVMSKQLRHNAILHLLLFCSPATVHFVPASKAFLTFAASVMSATIDSVYRTRRIWLVTHVLVEIFKRLPSLTDSDICIARYSRLASAPSYHSVPRNINPSSAKSMRRMSRDRQLPLKTSATLAVSMQEILTGNRYSRATVARTNPVIFPARIPFHGNKPAKSLSSPVFAQRWSVESFATATRRVLRNQVTSRNSLCLSTIAQTIECCVAMKPFSLSRNNQVTKSHSCQILREANFFARLTNSHDKILLTQGQLWLEPIRCINACSARVILPQIG